MKVAEDETLAFNSGVDRKFLPSSDRSYNPWYKQLLAEYQEDASAIAKASSPNFEL